MCVCVWGGPGLQATCVCSCLGGTWAPGRLCVCVCLGGPGLQEGLDFYVPVLTLRVFSIESVAGYY